MSKDLAKFLLPASLPSLTVVKTGRKIKLSKGFLGPIPEWWAIKAANAGLRYGSYGAVIVGLLLWRAYWFAEEKQPVKLTRATLRKAGCKRHFTSSGLSALERSGLITVQKFGYRSPLITIVTEPAPNEATV
jgi:hypothetical protein